MLYSEQVTRESFRPFSCVPSLFSLEILNEVRSEGERVLFSGCRFEADKNRGSLKINNSTNINFKKCTFDSGLERCIEMSRAHNILFNDCCFNLAGNRQILINCSSNLIKFFDCNFIHKGKPGNQAMMLGAWTEEEKVWRPPVSGISFEGCSFSEGLVPYLAARSTRPNILGKLINPWIVNLAWYVARKLLRKKKGVDYSIYEHEQM